MGEHPYYRFFRRISFDLNRRLWERMPRHPCFKHEYLNGRLHWTPRPNTCDVFLDLEQWQPPAGGRNAPLTRQEPVAVRALQEQDWQKLPDVFCAASAHWPPLSQWRGAPARRAARCIIEWARRGRDGPLVLPACRVAVDGDRGPTTGQSRVVGAAIVTLVPAERLRSAPQIETEDLPHLDWIFVSWLDQRRGIATLLLTAVVQELRALGRHTLASTVLSGNPQAMLWHWSRGFRLPPGTS